LGPLSSPSRSLTVYSFPLRKVLERGT
jgi:hypothetical protein